MTRKDNEQINIKGQRTKGQRKGGISRRGMFGLGAAGVLAAGCVTSPDETLAPELVDAAFEHGVAAGDATSTQVVLWTRVTPKGDAAGFDVHVLVSTDRAKLEGFDASAADPIGEAGVEMGLVTSTSAARDYTVKVDLGAAGSPSLAPATTYFYAFAIKTPSGMKLSPIGAAKTLPATGMDDFRAAVVSCSNLPFGFFNAYEAIAKRDDVDALIHLGDYLYEYGRDGYGGDVGVQIGREVEPPHEIVSLDDYRTRYAQYRRDPQLQAAHAACVWYITWDDHESTNNSYRTGAENHQPDTEGEWSVRKAQAVQAWLEWMPVRDPEAGRALGSVYRSFDIGDLATLFMLETRLLGRSDELTFSAAMAAPEEDRMAVVQGIVAEAQSSDRTMMGPVQEHWLDDGLKASVKAGKRWQVLGNQVIMARVTAPNVVDAIPAQVLEGIYAKTPYLKPYLEFTRYGLPLNLDAWDGYDAARERLYVSAREAGARLVTLTGDTHTAWANELFDKSGARRGVEFGCTSITSPGLGTMLPMPQINQMMTDKNPEVAFYDAFGHGFTLLTLSQSDVRADFVKVSDILTTDYTVATADSFRAISTSSGVSNLVRATAED